MKSRVIYLVRKRGLGDVLWTEPIVRQLAATYRKVVVYTKYPELFAHYPASNVHVTSKLSWLEKLLIGIDTRLHLGFFSINLEMAYEKDPQRHMLQAYAEKAGLSFQPQYPQLHLSPAEATVRLPAKPYMVLHLETFSERNFRRIYGIDWDEIAGWIGSLGFRVIQIGKKPDQVKHTEIVQTGLREMISLIHGASFFIGLDSGPSHIAASLGVPSLIFFGAVNPSFRHFPEQFRGFFLQQFCEFAGCYHTKTSINGVTCRIVGEEGIPPCSLHSNEYLRDNIELLIKNYNIA